MDAHGDLESALACSADFPVCRIADFPVGRTQERERRGHTSKGVVLRAVRRLENRRYGRLKTCATEDRFMESLQSQKMVVHWDHEPQICKLLEINETIPRFMESPDDLPITLWDLEPGRDALRHVLRGYSEAATQHRPTRFIGSL